MDDLVEKFSLEKLNPSPAAINFTKLDHFNGLHIRSLSAEQLAALMKPYFIKAGYLTDDDTLKKIAPLIQPRLVTLDEGPEWAGFFFKETVEPDPKDLVPKGLTANEALSVAEQVLEILSGLPDVSQETAEPPMRELVDKLGLNAGQVFGIMRIAITGQRVSPPLFESMEIIGKDLVIKRMQQAVKLLEGQISD